MAGLKKTGLQNYNEFFKLNGLELYASDGVPTENGAAKGALAIDTTNGALYINTGTVASATWNNVAAIATSEITLATGSVLIGTAGVGAALDGKTSGQILVGNGTTMVSVAVSGDATLSAAGAVAVTKINGATLGTATATSGNVLIGSGTAWVTNAISGDATLSSAGVLTTKKIAGNPFHTQAAPTQKTTSSTLTAAEVLAGIIAIAQGAGSTSAQQLPTATDFETAVAAIKTVANDDAVDFHVINYSTVDAEDASITTNTGWTLVGSMDIHAYSAAGSLNSSAHFRARRTSANNWMLFRLA